MIIIKKIIIFLSLFFLFNTLEVDSNSDKLLLYDKNNIYEEGYHNIYFNNMNTNELKKVLKKIKVNILSYIIEDKKYYASNVDEFIKEYLEKLDLKDKIYYEHNGIVIDGISITCTNEELMKLEELVDIY